MCRLDHLDSSSTQKLLMKTGLILIVIGHLNFITGALVHGTVLRHIANPRDTISVQYAVSNIITVISAMLTIFCGIAAIVLSRYVSRKWLKWAVLSLSVSSVLLSLFCMAGLAVAIVVTFANKGRTLLALCPFDVGFAQPVHECPFDPTRVYVKFCAGPLGHLLPPGHHRDRLQHPMLSDHGCPPQHEAVLQGDAQEEGLTAVCHSREERSLRGPGSPEDGPDRDRVALEALDSGPSGVTALMDGPQMPPQHLPGRLPRGQWADATVAPGWRFQPTAEPLKTGHCSSPEAPDPQVLHPKKPIPSKPLLLKQGVHLCLSPPGRDWLLGAAEKDSTGLLH